MNVANRTAVAMGFAAAVALSCSTKDPADDAKSPTLHIVPTSASERGKWIELRHPDSQFHVLVTNESKEPLNVWRQSSSWSWFNLSFLIKPISGGSIKLDRLPVPWTGNVPTPYLLQPGESFVIDVNFFDGTWLANGKELDSKQWPKAGRLEAAYAIPRDAMSQEEKVWAGAILTEEAYSFDVTPDLTAQFDRLHEGNARAIKDTIDNNTLTFNLKTEIKALEIELAESRQRIKKK